MSSAPPSLPAFQKKRICVLGICTVDAIARHIDEYPPPGGLRPFDSLTMTTGGNAVNCSIALAKMGFAVNVVTKVGDDENGRFVLAELTRHGVDVTGVIRSTDAHTPFSFVCVHPNGQRSFLHTVGTNGTLRSREVDLQLLRDTDLCLITGTMLMPSLDGPPTAALLQQARQAGTVTILDTSFTDSASRADWLAALEPCLPWLDYFVPSRAEAWACTGHDDPDQAARALLDRGCQTVVIKLDEQGACYRDANGATGHVPAYPVPAIVDTTGAGDCWCAGFLAGLAQTLPIDAALRLGNAVAAFCIQQAGASEGIPTLVEVQRFQGGAW